MFKLHGTLETTGAPVLKRLIIGNSQTLGVLESVKNTTGFIVRGTAGVSVVGHALNIGTDKGVGLENFDSMEVVTDSDNTTVDKYKAEVDVSKMTLYSGLHDGTAGTTGRQVFGYMVDLADHDELDESTTHATTASQYLIWGQDGDEDNRAVVSIFESRIFGPLSA
jgi:hypothetical protein